MRKHLKRSVAIAALTVCCIALMAASACSVTPAGAANLVNKYADSLQAVVNAEIALHGSMKADGVTPVISDDLHIKILKDEKIASQAGHDLDAAITVAASGGDITQYVTVAQTSFDNLIADFKIDPSLSTQMQVIAQAASDALKNAISIIQALRAKSPPKITTANSHPSHGLEWALGSLFLVGLAAGGGAGPSTAGNILNIIQILLQLEPVAFDLITKFVTSLKGKSAAEIVALSEGVFNNIDAQIDAELAKTKAK